ncbi:MAG: mechanosensitive ion channel family protein [Bacilli bacterium]|nr:mechanosensitive ion channel family protein [Bacilli bacterium]
MIEWIKNFFNEYQRSIIITIIIGLVAAILLIFLHIVTHQARLKAANKRASSVALLLKKILTYFIILVIILAILGVWGFNITALLWGLGIIAIIIGISAHKLIHDILSGIVIIFGNYYEVDDIVEIKGFKGKVIAIRTRSTHLLNQQGELKIFAHGEVSEVINYSRHYSLASCSITVNHNTPIDEMIAILQERLPLLVDSFPQIVEGPNVIGMTDLTQTGIVITITAKTLSEQQSEVERAIKRVVLEVILEKGYHLSQDEVPPHDER